MFRSCVLLTFLVSACGTSDEAADEGADAGSVPDARPGETDPADAAVGDACGPATCAGCCMEGVCVDGMATDACGTGGEVCSVCVESQSCYGACDLDTSVPYDIVLFDAEIDSTKVNGRSWDINDGRPDVRLHGYTGWGDVIESSVKDNTISPDWMGEVVMDGGDLDAGFVGWVKDDDVISDDFICQLHNCPINPPNTTLECRVVRGSDSESEYDGPNAGCTIRYMIVPH